MSIAAGERVPDVPLTMLTDEGMKQVRLAERYAGKRVVLFAVPGAFTPTCSDRHLPGFIDKLAELKARGVDAVACVAVNDPFVMAAWGKARNVGEIEMLSDGNGEFTRALGLELDASRFSMGTRSRRYAALIDDGEVKVLNVEPAGDVGVSSAEAILAEL